MANIEVIGSRAIWVDTELGENHVVIGSRALYQQRAAVASGITGSGSPVEANDVAAGAGQRGVTGSGSLTENNDTASASGQRGSVGSGSPTDSSDTSSASGQRGSVGSSSETEANDTSSGTGSVTSAGSITGSGSPTEDNDFSNASGQIGRDATGSPTDGADLSNASGTITSIVYGGTTTVVQGSDLKVAYIKGTIHPTAGQTADFTADGFGTPKAALFLMAGTESDSVERDHASQSFGWWDGATMGMVSSGADNGVAPTDTARYHSDRFVAASHYGAGTSRDVQIEASSWITDGVRLNTSSNTFNRAQQILVILLGGNNFEAESGSFQLVDELTQATVSGLSFQPNHVLFGSASLPAVHSAGGTSSYSVGLAGADLAQHSHSFYSRNSVGTSETAEAVRAGSVIDRIDSSGSVYRVSVDSYTTDGFTMGLPTADPTDDYVHFIAFNIGGSGRLHAQTDLTPDEDDPGGETQTWSVPSTNSAQPYAGALFSTPLTSVNHSAIHDGFATSFFDNANLGTFSYEDEDAVTTSHTASESRTDEIVNPSGGVTDGRYAATYDGVTGNALNFTGTNWPGSPRLVLFFLFGEVAETLSSDGGHPGYTGVPYQTPEEIVEWLENYFPESAQSAPDLD